jgi:hypothetical protein
VFLGAFSSTKWMAIEAKLDPVTELLMLPVVQNFDRDAVAELLTVCVECGANSVVLKAASCVLALPAAVQLSAEQIGGLVEVCVQLRDRKIVQLLLQHPAAPGADDPELQLLLCACEDGIVF